MFVRAIVTPKLTDGQVRRLAADLAAAVGHDVAWVLRPEVCNDAGWHCLEIVDRLEQDGDPILPEPREQFVRVRLMGRYYGPGYERGNWPVIFGVRQWLLRRIPGSCEVWYGGDSSGFTAVPMTDEFCETMWGHFAAHGHEPYAERENPFLGASEPPRCSYCAGRRMTRVMYGKDGDGFRCAGCGLCVREEGGELVLCLGDRTHDPFSRFEPAEPRRVVKP